MNTTTKFIGAVMGVALLFPLSVIAEEAGVSDEVTAETSGGSASGGATVDSWSFGESNPSMPPPKPGDSAGRESPSRPSTGKPGVIAPRDAASGLPTGKRQYEPVIIQKEYDKATPKLMERSPRDAASGLPTGKTASGTLPKGDLQDRLDKRDEMMDKRASTSEAREERREEKMEQLMKKRMEVMKRMIEQQVFRMNAMIERLEKLADRLGSRIEKLKTKNVDTSEAETLLVEARGKIDAAKTALALAKEKAKTVIVSFEEGGGVTVASGDVDGDGGEAAREELGKNIRGALSLAREAVMAAHKALTEAIRSLNASVKVSGDASGSTGGGTTTNSTP